MILLTECVTGSSTLSSGAIDSTTDNDYVVPLCPLVDVNIELLFDVFDHISIS